MSNLLSNIGVNLTFLAVPWYLAHSYGDNGKLLGLSLIIGTFISFFIEPLFGGFVDTQSRKKLILLENSFGFFVIGVAAFIASSIHNIIVPLIIVVHIFNGLIRSFHYNNLTALNQEIFNKDQYIGISSITEIEGQLSVVFSGLFGAYLITHFNLSFIMGIDAFSYFLAFCLLIFLPYSQSYKQEFEKPSYFRDIKSGFNYALKNLRQMTLLFSLQIPFLVRGLTTMILPYYVADQLNNHGSTLGFIQIFYGIGAITGGMIIGKIINKFKTLHVLFTFLFLFCFSLACLAFSSIVLFAIGIQFVLGLSVSTLRISRNSIFMKYIDKRIIGRVDGLLGSLTTVLSLILTATISLTLVVMGANFSYGILLMLIIVSMLGTLVGFRREVMNDQ